MIHPLSVVARPYPQPPLLTRITARGACLWAVLVGMLGKAGAREPVSSLETHNVGSDAFRRAT